MSLPLKKFAVGGIQVAVWENQGKEGKTYSKNNDGKGPFNEHVPPLAVRDMLP